MRQTFTTLITMCQDGAGRDTSTAAQTFFKRHINSRYETIISKLPSYLSEIDRTFSTVADQQYYHYPPAYRKVEALEITINSVKYVLTPIFSRDEWNRLNAITIQSGAIPRYFFNRQRDFGIWPIPQAAYTGTITYNLRAGGMTAADYTTGTVTVTENDATITGSGTTFTAAMVDRWFVLTDSNGLPRGDWYRVGSFTSTTSIELESVYETTTEAGATYIIGESPELPDEMHELLAWGALEDYFLGFRQGYQKATVWGNKFWTGDPSNRNRDSSKVQGGLLGYIHTYQDRDESQLVERKSPRLTSGDKVWASSLSDSS